MKKIYTTPQMSAVSNFKNSCSPYQLSFIKTLSLVSVAVFLSNASPVSACDLWGNVAKYFGGGADIRRSIAPAYEIDGNVYRDVGSAFWGVNNAFRGVRNALDTAFKGWGNIWAIYQKEINNKFDKILSDMIVKQNDVGTITIGANKMGYVVDIANSYRESRIIMGVRDGAVVPKSDQAINGGQLYTLGAGVAESLGGSANYYSNGRWSAPVFLIQAFDENGNQTQQNYKSVADVFGSISNSFANLNKVIKNVATNAAGNGLVQQDTAGLITIGGKVSGTRVSIANVDNAVRILSGVKSGSITATSNDAINGSQLYSMSNVVAGYFGGGAKYKEGNWSAPTFTVKVFDKNGNGTDKDYQNVADAFTGVNSSFTNLDKKIENIVINGTSGSLVQQDDTGLITIGGKVGGTRVSIANVDNAVRILSGIKSGSITATSNDAINGSQLYSMSNVIAGYFSRGAGYGEDGNWNAPTFTVKVFDKDGSGTEMRYENVADALSGVSSSFTNLNKKIEHVTGDAFIKQNSAGLITIGGSKGGNRIDISNNINNQRILSGVKGGAFTKTSTEAVNGAQIYYMTRTFASYFGGGAGYGEDGQWSGPTFTIKAFDKDGNETEKNYSSVADAFAGVNSAFTTLNNQIVEIKDSVGIDEKNKIPENGDVSDIISEDFPFMRSISLKSLPRALGDLKDATTVTIAAKSPLKQISFMNSKGESRRLFDIAAGEISETSTDAVTGSQLYLLNNHIATYLGGGSSYKNGNWISPTFTIKAFDKDGNETEKNYNNVADAFAGVNSAFTTLNNQIVKISNGLGIGETGYQSQDDDLSGIIPVGFPFMRSLPRSIDETKIVMMGEEEADGEDASKIYFSADSPATQVSFKNDKGENRHLFDIAAGEISKTSTDAVNGSQIYLLGNEVAGYFGGGAGYSEGGQWAAPTFKVFGFKEDGAVNNEIGYGTVAEAFTGISKVVSKINDRLNIVEQKGTSNVASNGFAWNREKEMYDVSHNGKESKIDKIANGNIAKGSTEAVNGGQLWEVDQKVNNAVSYDTDQDGKKTNSITLKGADASEPVLIDNVKDGKIEAKSHEAVNGGQLHNYTAEQMKIVLGESKQYTDRKFEALSYDIQNVRKEARQAAAIGLAVSNLRYFDDPGSLSISFGGGLWHGQSAIAFGAGYTSEDGRIRSNLSATSAGGQWGVGGGITLKLK